MSARAKSTARTVRYVEVGADHVGRRIDNFLAHYLRGVPRSHLYRILRSGEVRVNKGRVRPDYRLMANDRIRVPPVRSGVPAAFQVPREVQARLEGAVLLEDDDLIALNKPAGLAVHGGSRLDYGLIEVLRKTRPHAPMLELVHRLDRDTSGCLLIAKSRRMLGTLHGLLREGRIDKQYTTLVAGVWRGGAREVAVAVARRRAPGRVSEPERGKQALSLFKPVVRFDDSTLMVVRIRTGRTHQIRVHAAHVGHPVAGDDKYGDRAFNRRLRSHGLRRLFLHAARLEFRIPDAGRRYTIEAPLDAALQQVLDRFAARVA